MTLYPCCSQGGYGYEHDFQRRFELADHVKVQDASLDDGLLRIDLKRELPEEMKPRRIAIANGDAQPKIGTRQIEADTLAA